MILNEEDMIYRAELEALMAEAHDQIRKNPDAEQVIAIRTARGNLHLAVLTEDDVSQEAEVLKKMKEQGDTKVICFLAIWNDGNIDCGSKKLREGIRRMNWDNYEALTVIRSAEVFTPITLRSLYKK